MTNVTSGETRSVTIKRMYRWSAGKLFEAWTDPDLMRKWLVPNEAMQIEATNDLKVGGRYRLAFRQTDGTLMIAFGEYRQIDPPTTLAFTWAWEGGGAEPAETLVTVNFVTVSGGTELTLTHERLSSEESAARHAAGWNGCLDSLQKFIEA